MAKFTAKLQRASRRKKLDCLLKAFKPTKENSVLAVGVDASSFHSYSNYVEYNYPFTGNVVGLTNTPKEQWLNEGVPIKLVYGDGRDLPFTDDSFDIAISNAVIEHVGNRDQQRQFVGEMCRVANRVFITTPNFYFPVELHTRLPFVQFMPAGIRNWMLNNFGHNKYYAAEWGRGLNLLTARDLRSLFPKNMKVHVFGLRSLLMAESLIAIAERID